MKILPALPEGNNPCRDCIKRKVGCHGKCEDYKEFKEKVAELRKRQRYQFTGRTTYEPRHRPGIGKNLGRKKIKGN